MGKREFSGKSYVAPFGRYQSGSEAGASNELLVGREEQRAYFIELLLRMERRGAYLVTGRRGVGKTSFVNYCLAEYKEEVFERFLRSSVGRVLFWDHAGVILLSFGIIFLLLLVSEFLEIVALSTGWGKGASPDVLFGLVILPLAIVCIYPMLYARSVFGRIISSGEQDGGSRSGILATLVTIAIATVAFFAPPFGSPALSMGRIFLAIAALYLWVQATSFNNRPNQYRWWISPVSVALILIVTSSLIAEEIPILPPVQADQEFLGNLLWGVCLIGAANLLRWLHLRKLPNDIAKSASSRYLGLGIFLILGGFPLLGFFCYRAEVSPATLIAATLSVGASLALFWISHPANNSTAPSQASFQPQPQLILGVKAILCIILSLQLVHPLFDKWTPAQEAAPPSNSPSQLRSPTPLWHISSLSRQERDERLLGTGYKTPNPAVFYGRREELSWVLGLFLCLATIFHIEYEWILRPFIREREDTALDHADPAPWQDQILSEKNPRNLRSLASLTLPWILYERWLPVLAISVNLGFEKLDHRRVVHAMLAGLRDQYYRTFAAWNSGFANLWRILSALLLMMLVTLAGDRWFNMPDLPGPIDVKTAKWSAGGNYNNICLLFQGRQMGPGAANWICKIKGDNSIFHILYYNLLQTKDLDLYSARDRHLLFYIFPYRESDWPPEHGADLPPLLAKGIHFRVYHVILLVIFFLLGRWLLHRVPIFPYQEILNRIDDTMDNLSSRTSITSTTGRWKPAQWLQGFFMDERVRQTEQDPVDPRTVEFVFLQILRDIQGVTLHLPGGRTQLISLPTPEITFVLDELDKIGTRIDPDEVGSSGGVQQAEILNSERRRSMELHKLLADMKNLLSSAPARFIFVGGRNLHDEWLADQTARQPLLTNIFTAEIYLPSLLIDSDDSDRRLIARVHSYVYNEWERARKFFRFSREKQWLPLLALPLDRAEREAYLQHRQAASEKNLIDTLKIYDTVKVSALDTTEQSELIRDFLQFLTYRSMGNPKKLKELLSTFVRPAGRVINKEVRWDKKVENCDHVLLFGDTERFRLQLLARVYRHLTFQFEPALVHRDDKLAASVLYLTDFLFKFHRRAFSWSNLERVDELVHIHRAPDLREILEAIVAQWSERFLHPIRNGMYDFRFRSDMAREIAYVSRQSAEEMAAFNFTLDESQTLKSAYEVNIARLREGNGKELQDLVAGLGELHEFDQEYDTARFYYRRAISLLDEELEEVIGGGVLSESSSRIEIIGGAPAGQESARLYMTWGIARLRLMLQIGMTFEHSRNLERAEMEYQNARTLAQSLLIAMLDDAGRAEAKKLKIPQAFGARGDDRLHALKHLNILFQPMFAEIWVAEKLAGGVDTSTSLAEKELRRLRNLLPFVRERKLKESTSGAEAQGSNFALIATELHNKTGDLYFFKGRQISKSCAKDWLVNETDPNGKKEGAEGYLLAAHYHYAVGLHELRRFIVHRKRSSKNKWSLQSTTCETIETIVSEGWPDFVFRAVGGAFNDLAEALLARISLRELFNGLSSATSDIGELINDRLSACTVWLESDPVSDSKPDGQEEPSVRPVEWPGEWLGQWHPSEKTLLYFTELPNAKETFIASIEFSLVGALYLKAGGYIEDAGREFLKVCETITHYLWWGLMVRNLTLKPATGWASLFDFALYALQQSKELFFRSRQPGPFVGDQDSSDKDKFSQLGQAIPVFSMTLAFSLRLALEHWGTIEHIEKGLDTWMSESLKSSPSAESVPAESVPKEKVRRALKKFLVRHSYPMINRLHALKLLIDDAVLSFGENEDEKKKGEILSWAYELLEMEASLNAPLHFTPLQSGTTCAMICLTLKEQSLRNTAERRLLSSQEMYTMRRSFYENISDLYYLYDDFNDRQLHFNHAIQMAGSELACLLQYRLASMTNTVAASQDNASDSNAAQPVSPIMPPVPPGENGQVPHSGSVPAV